MALSEKDRRWYIDAIEQHDPDGNIVSADDIRNVITYSDKIRSDENRVREITPEELVHALSIVLLTSNQFGYPPTSIIHEKHYKHGSTGSLSDEVDILIEDEDGLPYAIFELKSSDEFNSKREQAIENQLFGTAPLVGAPRLLVFGTIHPTGDKAVLTLECIDYTKYSSYSTWVEEGRPILTKFPSEYRDPQFHPYIRGADADLREDCKQSDFRSVASVFHNEFFGEHPDNVLFVSLVKCLLAKIFDERNTKIGDTYQFQILQKNGKEESASEIYDRVNSLYATAYKRYIDPASTVPDEINTKEFPADRVKTVVKVLQGMSITRGAALHGDVIGAFFEEILRIGFKQDKGMYFTHDNLVAFMVEAIDLKGLTRSVWRNATHPDNRLPYVIDPACGSGTFLLRAMNTITEAIKAEKIKYVNDFESEQFYNARMSDAMPNYWAENFLYGLDPKFVMALTAKVNMVLHGDGSAHIFKDDAFKELAALPNNRFRPIGDNDRTVLPSMYPHSMCETFDVVLSNPPFGVTLSSQVRTKLTTIFSLPDSCPSEALFIERCFQLLKPKGRMGIVIPESVLNTAEAMDVRLLIYRFFWIRAIVGLPRNAFIDTPTLTSLLFAQKKTAKEISAWDAEWAKHDATAKNRFKDATIFLKRATSDTKVDAHAIERQVLKLLKPIITEHDTFVKRGRNAAVVTTKLPTSINSKEDAAQYYRELFKLAAVRDQSIRFAFSETAKVFDYEYPSYLVDEVGYKLSKRKEKIRPNQLLKILDINSDNEYPNLHLCDRAVRFSIEPKHASRIIDFLRRDVKWS